MRVNTQIQFSCVLWVGFKLTGVQGVAVVRAKHALIIHPAAVVDAVTLPVRLVAPGSRRRRLAAVLAAVDDFLAGHVHGLEAPSWVEPVDHGEHVCLAQTSLVELYELVDRARVDEAARGDGA